MFACLGEGLSGAVEVAFAATDLAEFAVALARGAGEVAHRRDRVEEALFDFGQGLGGAVQVHLVDLAGGAVPGGGDVGAFAPDLHGLEPGAHPGEIGEAVALVDDSAVDVAGPVKGDLIGEDGHHRFVELGKGFAGAGERQHGDAGGGEAQGVEAGVVESFGDLLELLGEVFGDVVAAFVDGDQGVDVEQVGQDPVVGRLVVQAAGAVDPDPGDGEVAAVEPLQGDLDGLHRGAMGVVGGIEPVKGLLRELHRVPAVAEAPGGQAVIGEVAGGEFLGFGGLGEVVVGGTPITSDVGGARGGEVVVRCHGDRR